MVLHSCSSALYCFFLKKHTIQKESGDNYTYETVNAAVLIGTSQGSQAEVLPDTCYLKSFQEMAAMEQAKTAISH